MNYYGFDSNDNSVIHPIFDMTVKDDIIRRNPSDGVMAEIKKQSIITGIRYLRHYLEQE